LSSTKSVELVGRWHKGQDVHSWATIAAGLSAMLAAKGFAIIIGAENFLIASFFDTPFTVFKATQDAIISY
jgi:hypothetical protein